MQPACMHARCFWYRGKVPRRRRRRAEPPATAPVPRGKAPAKRLATAARALRRKKSRPRAALDPRLARPAPLQEQHALPRLHSLSLISTFPPQGPLQHFLRGLGAHTPVPSPGYAQPLPRQPGVPFVSTAEEGEATVAFLPSGKTGWRESRVYAYAAS